MIGKNFWAWIVDESVAHSPTLMMDHADRHDAAQSYAAMLIEDSEGDVTTGAVRVWDHDGASEDATFYDFSATLTPYEGEDAEEGEVECQLELVERD